MAPVHHRPHCDHPYGQYPHLAVRRQASARSPPGPAVRHAPATAGADGTGKRAPEQACPGCGLSRGLGRPGRIDGVSVQLNHTIVSCRDQQPSAAFLTGILGLPAPTRFGHFLVVVAANGVSLDFAETTRETASQHYAFRVAEAELDAPLG